MRFIILILILCVTLVLAIFSTQNSQPVSITVLTWSFEASLAIIMFLSVVFGLIIGFMASFAFRSSKKQKRAPSSMTPGHIGSKG